MANTKNLDPKARKKAKREKRLEFKAKLLNLSVKERKELRKFEGTAHQFFAAKEQEKKKAAQAAAEAPKTQEEAPSEEQT